MVEETTIATPERSDIHIDRIVPLWVANGLRDIDPGMDAKSNNATSSSGLLPSVQYHSCRVDRGHHALLVAAPACNKSHEPTSEYRCSHGPSVVLRRLIAPHAMAHNRAATVVGLAFECLLDMDGGPFRAGIGSPRGPGHRFGG